MLRAANNCARALKKQCVLVFVIISYARTVKRTVCTAAFTVNVEPRAESEASLSHTLLSRPSTTFERRSSLRTRLAHVPATPVLIC